MRYNPQEVKGQSPGGNVVLEVTSRRGKLMDQLEAGKENQKSAVVEAK